jgi:predicted transcriptional regulator YdeE
MLPIPCGIFFRLTLAIGTPLCLVLNAGSGGSHMNPRIVQQSEFTVVGISTRTNNAREATADGVIGKQWERFMQDGVLGKIPHKLDRSIIAVYTDYANDHNGDYTFLLGAKVSSVTDLPEGFVEKKIPAGRYVVFTTQKGPGPKVVPELWTKINSLPKSAPGGNRAYRADFEIYDDRAADPQNVQVDVYVGIK